MKYAFIVGLFFLGSCGEQKVGSHVITPPLIENEKTISDQSLKRIKMISYAKSLLETPYDYQNTNGFDCSGFVRHCYNHIGVNVPRSSLSQSKAGKEVSITDAELGDIIVFTGSDKNKRIAGHTGLVSKISNDTIYFIHSTLQKGVMIDHNQANYYKNRYLTTRSYLP